MRGFLASRGRQPPRQCLVVRHRAKHGHGNGYSHEIVESSLGIYLPGQLPHHHPVKFNYSQFCRGNLCSVPVEKLPGYPKLCHKKLILTFDNDRYHSKGLSEVEKVVKVVVGCKDLVVKQKPICCCPPYTTMELRLGGQGCMQVGTRRMGGEWPWSRPMRPRTKQYQ